MQELGLKANLTVPEAAEYLGIGESTMWLRIKQGKVQTYKNGKLRKIKREALLQYEAEMIAESASN